MKFWLTCAAVLGATPAVCADLNPSLLSPQKAITWTGFYAGINAGGAWSLESGYNALSNSSINPQSTGSSNGYTAGIQAGYNYAADRFVIGFELSASKTNASSDSNYTFIPSYTYPSISNNDVSAEIQWSAAARMRLGITATDRFLIYGIFGGALASIKTSSSGYYITPYYNNIWSYSGTSTKIGFSIGTGATYKFTQNISCTIEANYIYFGDVNQQLNTGVSGGNINLGGTVAIATVQAGLNYHF